MRQNGSKYNFDQSWFETYVSVMINSHLICTFVSCHVLFCVNYGKVGFVKTNMYNTIHLQRSEVTDTIQYHFLAISDFKRLVKSCPFPLT